MKVLAANFLGGSRVCEPIYLPFTIPQVCVFPLALALRLRRFGEESGLSASLSFALPSSPRESRPFFKRHLPPWNTHANVEWVVRGYYFPSSCCPCRIHTAVCGYALPECLCPPMFDLL